MKKEIENKLLKLRIKQVDFIRMISGIFHFAGNLTDPQRIVSIIESYENGQSHSAIGSNDKFVYNVYDLFVENIDRADCEFFKGFDLIENVSVFGTKLLETKNFDNEIRTEKIKNLMYIGQIYPVIDLDNDEIQKALIRFLHDALNNNSIKTVDKARYVQDSIVYLSLLKNNFLNFIIAGMFHSLYRIAHKLPPVSIAMGKNVIPMRNSAVFISQVIIPGLRKI